MTTNNAINIDQPGVTYYDGAGSFTGFALNDGELVIGNTGSAPAAATLTAGTNVTISNGPSSIIISAIGGGGTGFQVISRQVFSTVGTFTYTPSAGMLFCDIEVCGGGAAGYQTGGAGDVTGGGGGGYARGIFTASEIGASQSVIVGEGGLIVTGAAGLPGGDSSVGTLIFGLGGQPGATRATPGLGGAGIGGDYQVTGQSGPSSATGIQNASMGGSSFFGGAGVISSAGATFRNAVSFGGGGAGGSTAGTAGNGFQGIVIITEYIGTGATIQRITYLTAASSPHVVQTADVFFSVDSSAGPVTLQFPDAPLAGQEWTVKDSAGSSSINPITLTSMSGALLFDGSTSVTISTNYASQSLIANNIPSYELY